jgi:endonuclease/exonuclease/phosphatase (EEP) superfamily protein YafD
MILMVIYLFLRLILGDALWWLGLLNALAIYTFAPLIVLLPLAALARLWHLLARLALLAVLGIMWFGPFFQPKPSVTPVGMQSMRVITFNVWHENPRLDEVEEWLAEMAADVVLLQEIPAEYVENGIPALDELYPEQIVATSPASIRLLSLSRHPVIEIDEPQRHYQRLVVEVSGQPIAVYNVHFPVPVRNDARLSVDLGLSWLNVALSYDESRRNAQIQELLDALRDEELPFVVGGDFNMSQHSITYGSLAVVMTDSFRATNSGLGATWPVIHGPDFAPTLLRLDYIWHGRRLRSLRSELGPTLGSDRLPVMAQIEILTLRPPEAAGSG